MNALLCFHTAWSQRVKFINRLMEWYVIRNICTLCAIHETCHSTFSAIKVSSFKLFLFHFINYVNLYCCCCVLPQQISIEDVSVNYKLPDVLKDIENGSSGRIQLMKSNLESKIDSKIDNLGRMVKADIGALSGQVKGQSIGFGIFGGLFGAISETYINPSRGTIEEEGIERTDHPTFLFVLRTPSLSFRLFLLCLYYIPYLFPYFPL
uniref:Uncharacterized protein n=1 Tax=Heterorhabditis bacteriophora TaxID=37862 RepID=A0A1I7XSJ3_HETBA